MSVQTPVHVTLSIMCQRLTTIQQGKLLSQMRGKMRKMCNVKDSFPQIEIPKNCIHIIKNIRDWEAIAENFLQTVHRTKVST